LPVKLYQDKRIIGWRDNYVYKLPSGEVVTVYEDQTERKLNEFALKESSEKYRNLFETMAQGVVYQNTAGEIISANPAAQRILGLTLDQLQGRTSTDPAWQSIHPDGSDFPGHTHPAMVALLTGQEVRNVMMGICKPGQPDKTWININATPQFEPGQPKPYQVYAIFEDITERVREEQQRKEQLEQELRALDVLSAPPQTTITAEAFGLIPLWQNLPDIFNKLVAQYVDLMDLALEQRVYKVEHHLSDRLRGVAQRLGQLRAGPRDVVELHTTALRVKTRGVSPLKSKAYVEEGHLLALELMGYLASYYRHLATGNFRESDKGAINDR
jgi:PAS domain S-box-containing protein